MPLSGAEAEPTSRLSTIHMSRLWAAVRRVDVQPSALRAAEQETMVKVGGDLLDMAEMHILIIATVVAASFVHI
jgi:hypothetical protein